MAKEKAEPKSKPAPFSPLAQAVLERIYAGFSGLYIESCDPQDAIEEIRRMCLAEGIFLALWDDASGMHLLEKTEAGRWAFVPYRRKLTGDPNGYQSSDLVQSMEDAVIELGGLNDSSAGDEPQPALLILKMGHRYLDGPVLQRVINQVYLGRGNHQHLAILSPIVRLPVELEALKLFHVIEHALPDRPQLEEIARSVATGPGELPSDPAVMDLILDAGAGMPRLEFEAACALSIVRHGVLSAEEIFAVKQAMLKTQQALTLHKGQETFADVGGLDALKAHCLRVLRRREPNPKFRARGVLIMGVPGVGKTLFAKALGNETGRPTLFFNVGATMGSLLGQTQAQFRAALKTVDAMAPCILFIDEVEKALAGVAGSGRTNGGVKAEIFGYLLTWLEEHTSDVFTIATCNNITKLSDDNPEFIRRFDSLFFVDFPDREAKDAIWGIHLLGHELAKEQEMAEELLVMLDHLVAKLEGDGKEKRIFQERTANRLMEILDDAERQLAENGIGAGLQDAFRQVRSVVGTSGGRFKERIAEGSPDYRPQVRERLAAVAESLFEASEIVPRRAILRRRLQSKTLSDALPAGESGKRPLWAPCLQRF